MNSARPSFRQVLHTSVLALTLLVVTTGGVRAQVAVSADEFYRQGNYMSDQVSGFMRRIFGSGAPVSQGYVQRTPSAPALAYAQPAYPQPAYRSPAAVQAPSTRAYRSPNPGPVTASKAAITPKKSVASKPKSTPPAYVATAPAKTTRTSEIKSAPVSKPKADDAPKGGFYTSSSRKSSAVEDITTGTTPGSSSSLTVVNAPSSATDRPATAAGSSGNTSLTPIIPPAGAGTSSTASTTKTSEPTIKSTPPEPAKSGTSSSSSVSVTGAPSTVNFPTGTLGSKPGRVVSPYPPHTELNVRGLPSGSLAVDPTTQKVFKVP